ncbi:MAG TPA: hypothetical protein VKQ32_12655 [Polyangia bacterium]|nr:hypothetical protein [Polyangia bacterium]
MPASRSATTTLGITIVVVAALGAVGGVLIARRAGAKINGGVTAEGASVGTFKFNASSCASGHAFVPGFFGVELRGSGGQALRVVDSGPRARLWLYGQFPTQPALGIGQPSCSEWDVRVDWAGVVVNRVKAVNGHVNVTCAVGGGTVTAHVTFERCAL